MKYRNRQTNDTHTPIDIRRRRILAAVAAGGGAAVLGGLSVTRGADAPSGAGVKDPAGNPKKVEIVFFDDQGERMGTRRVPKVVKTAAQWKKQLSPQSYHITREGGTEPPFSGDYTKPDKPGIFHCICCDTALYAATTMFHSGTGWPSFYQPIAKENVTRHSDHTFGMSRTEIKCTRCDAHLGHVFHDGPQPTGLRYCMDSAALRFEPNGEA